MIIVLGGNSVSNRAWALRITEVLEKKFDPVVSLAYDHWDSSGQDIDFELELRKLRQASSASQNYVIIAKSAGILLTMEGIKRGFLNPQALIAIGTPLRYAEYRGIATEGLYRPAQKVSKILCIQHDEDPQGATSELKKIISTEIDLLELPGQDHLYNEVTDIASLAQKFLLQNKISIS